jgi:hypothetical protein
MAEVHPTTAYRGVPGFPGYRVGNDGSVWNCWINCRWGRRMTDRWKPMKIAVQPKRTAGRAYRYVNLTPPGEPYKTFRVHRLVLLAFVGPCPDGMGARHKDGDPGNNRLDNLCWDTPEANREDSRRLGRYSETPRNRRFTHDDRTLSLKEWATTLGVSYHTLWQRVFRAKMPFEEAISRPFLGVAGNRGKSGPRPRRRP